MSLEKRWCLSCINCSTEIPDELKGVLDQLKEYKYKIYCKVERCMVVANDNMWVDKVETCPNYKSK